MSATTRLSLRLHRSLSVKLLALSLTLLATVAITTGYLLFRTVREQTYTQVRLSAENTALTLEDLLVEQPQLFSSAVLEPLLQRYVRKLPDVATIRLLNARGALVAHSDPASYAHPDSESSSGITRALSRHSTSQQYIVRNGQRFLRLSRSLHGRYDPVRRSDITGAIEVEMQLTPVDERIARTFLGSMTVLLALLVLAGVITYHATRRFFVAPVLALVESADRLGRDGDAPAVYLRTGDELEVLGAAFNRAREERLEREASLRAARDSAEAASRTKSEFLANMSHEIRTPMNGVLGMLDLVLDAQLPQAEREHVEIARESAEALLDVLNDILDFSKIESGKLELDPVPFALSDVLGGTLGALALRADSTNLELVLDVASDVPEELVGDGGRLRQVMINLVSNAIKFTAAGEVVVRVESVAADQQQGPDDLSLRFSVSDTGIGIPVTKQQAIFEAFVQADGSTTREYGGTGLGLAISARLVTLMGGTLQVESDVGRGSTFHFTLPLRVHRDELPASRNWARFQESKMRGLTALIVDDNATNRHILERTTRGWGMLPIMADSGASALASVAEAIETGSPLQLLIVDAHMPDMDGFALVDRIRSSPSMEGATVMMLSSATHHDDAARCRRLGVARYLTKPIRRAQLRAAIAEVLGLAEGGATSDHAPAIKSPAPVGPTHALRILLAEDNLVNERLAVSLLMRQGHSVRVAHTGVEAMTAYSNERFDLILMDVQMPEMDGLQATEAIRARELASGAPRTPIIALTARAMTGDRERCLAAGMDSFVTKPLRTAELFAAIAEIVRPAGADGASAGPANAAPSDDAGEAPPVALDAVATLAAVGGDLPLLSELVDLFSEQFPVAIREIEEGLMSGRLGPMAKSAHRLKGSLQTFGARHASSLAGAIEEAGVRGDATAARSAHAALAAHLPDVHRALREICSLEGVA